MESAQQHDSKQASPAPVSFKPALLGAGLLFSVFLNAVSYTHLTLPTKLEV